MCVVASAPPFVLPVFLRLAINGDLTLYLSNLSIFLSFECLILGPRGPSNTAKWPARSPDIMGVKRLVELAKEKAVAMQRPILSVYE
jgi:hypothetical protein